ncbi:hypothetical protein OUZ56_031996 [Daphnia magna]|uniref:Uncharacterized protein n=1 Tax=Daphnia magna TaxID=35525 RepID=A0ABQ9ZVU2_9CRUS|nr:hypothetical protein OUZ56_031996 [Daphnia magna]
MENVKLSIGERGKTRPPVRVYHRNVIQKKRNEGVQRPFIFAFDIYRTILPIGDILTSGNEEDDDEAVQMLTTVCVGGVENRDVQQRRIMTEVVAVWCTSNAPYGPWIRAGQRRKHFRIEEWPIARDPHPNERAA